MIVDTIKTLYYNIVNFASHFIADEAIIIITVIILFILFSLFWEPLIKALHSSSKIIHFALKHITLFQTKREIQKISDSHHKIDSIQRDIIKHKRLLFTKDKNYAFISIQFLLTNPSKESYCALIVFASEQTERTITTIIDRIHAHYHIHE